MREAIDKARETGAGRPGLGADTFETFERLFREWKQWVAQPLHLETSDGVIRVVPQFLLLVIAESGPGVAMFNLNCDIVDQISASVTVRRLEAELTTLQGRHLRFTWNGFYDFRPSNLPESQKMTKICDADEIEI